MDLGDDAEELAGGATDAGAGGSTSPRLDLPPHPAQATSVDPLVPDSKRSGAGLLPSRSGGLAPDPVACWLDPVILCRIRRGAHASAAAAPAWVLGTAPVAGGAGAWCLALPLWHPASSSPGASDVV